MTCTPNPRRVRRVAFLGLTILPRKPAPWSVYNAKEWGWSHIAVSNATHLRMDYYGNVPLGVTPPIHHSFDIVRAFPRV